MSLVKFTAEVRPGIESELKRTVDGLGKDQFNDLRGMLAYHLGWEGQGAGEKAQGKRIRPLLVLLSTVAAGKDWTDALPAAAAVELIHNFSLIHDDIEDHSDYRHGRKTVWAIWGAPQAINAGDCMFSLAFQALIQSQNKPEYVISAVNLLQDTCVKLTKGQYLDMAYETKGDLPSEAYWTMVGGKTAALLSCSAAIGASITGADQETIQTLQAFAWNLGLAFQAQDDWLGIWGDSALTGKSTDSDLMCGKKSLPVILGLSTSGIFRDRWAKQPFHAEEIPELAGILENAGVQKLVETETARLTGLAKNALNSLKNQNEAVSDLRELADLLLDRKK
jgi:geranylgeranyl diphosphate synthase, type I